MTPQRYFVTGIDTGVGKTIASAVLCETLGADYWKPVQAGTLDASDSDAVRSLVSDPRCHVHQEGVRLVHAASPHAAAAREGRTVRLSDFPPPPVPTQGRPLVIEGAGGLLVPLNHAELLVDGIQAWGTRAILVSRHRLGSINHTLLTLRELERRHIMVAAIVFNGPCEEATESAILERTHVEQILRLDTVPSVDRAFVQSTARAWRSILGNSGAYPS